MKGIIEGLLFVSGEDGLTILEITELTGANIEEVTEALNKLKEDYNSSDRGINLEYLGNHFKLTTKSEHKEYYQKLIDKDANSTLSQSALETLAIIAYNEPITRIEIDEIRGVNSSYIIRKLLLKGLIKDLGKSDLAGRPNLYGVTSKFLDYFGLGTIKDLPEIKVEEEVIDTEKSLFESKYKEEI